MEIFNFNSLKLKLLEKLRFLNIFDLLGCKNY